jgi:hypothetical protein
VPKAPHGAEGPLDQGRPVGTRSALIGAAIALLGHAATVAFFLANHRLQWTSLSPQDVALAAQSVLALVLIPLGATLLASMRRDRGLGLGLLVGWGVGLAVCAVYFNTQVHFLQF